MFGKTANAGSKVRAPKICRSFLGVYVCLDHFFFCCLKVHVRNLDEHDIELNSNFYCVTFQGGGEVTVNGKPMNAKAGQKVSQVMKAAGVKMTYSCNKGNCGTCELFMNGRIEKACVAKIPSGKVTIQTN